MLSVMKALPTTALLAIAVALAGCGASHKQPPRPTLTTQTTMLGGNRVPASNSPDLISMRRIDGATYETVEIHADGTGNVGLFIGEWSGVVHRGFALGSREMGQIRHLVAIANRVRRTPSLGSISPSTEYIIFTGGHVLETAKGRVPPELASLTGILSGLVNRYS